MFIVCAHLDQNTSHLSLDRLKVKVAVVADNNLDVESLSAGLDTGNGLRVAVLVNEESALLAVGGGPAHQHGLSSSRTLVQKRGIGNGHASKIRDHGLIVEERLQTTLGNLGLVRSVLGVPANIIQLE